MSIVGMDCDNCIHRSVCGHSVCSFRRRDDDLIASGDNVEVCIGNDEPFYSKVEIRAYYGYQTPIADTMKIKHLTLYTEKQLKEILKDE